MNSDIQILIGGKQFKGWKSYAVSRSMDSFAGVARLSCAEKSEFTASKWDVRMGDDLVVRAADVPVLTGYMEDFNVEYDKNGHTVDIQARDKTADLVDCSWVESAKSWQNRSVLNVVKTLVKPFSIDLTYDDTVAGLLSFKPASIAINEGETVFDCISRIVGKQGVRPMSTGYGKLLLTVAGTELSTTVLKKGVNILRAGMSYSDRDRFSEYYCKGQSTGGAALKGLGDFLQPQEGRATDPIIKRYRPLTILTDGLTDAGTNKKRAKAEAAVRAGNSRAYWCDVQGWLQDNGMPWALNTLVQVEDSTLDINGTMLINGINFRFDDAGTFTSLTLMHADKFKTDADLSKITSEFDESGGGALASLGL